MIPSSSFIVILRPAVSLTPQTNLARHLRCGPKHPQNPAQFLRGFRLLAENSCRDSVICPDNSSGASILRWGLKLKEKRGKVGQILRGFGPESYARVLGFRRSLTLDGFFEAQTPMNESEPSVEGRRARQSAAATGYLRLPRPMPEAAILDKAALLARVGDD